MVKINIFINSTEYITFKQGDVIFNAADEGELACSI